MIREPIGIASPGEPVRVAAAVPVLVVVQDPRVDRVDLEPVEDRVPQLRVRAHELSLGRRRAGRASSGSQSGTRDLAEVVEQPCEPHLLDRLLVEAELRRDRRWASRATDWECRAV